MRLKRQYDSMYQAARKMEQRIERGTKENLVLRTQLENCQQNLEQQKIVVRQHIQQSKETEAELVQEIRDLRATMKENGLKVP
jgi:uncharacterized membrane-anchored protein YhcB (DUF1043 family)